MYDYMRNWDWVNSKLEEDVDSDDENVDETRDNYMLCPLSGERMVDPVMIKDCGHTFDRKNIEAKFDEGEGPFRECPICGVKFAKIELCTNEAVLEVLQIDCI